MNEQPPTYRREFFRSPHHAFFALATLGGGFVLGADQPLALVIGAASYVLGWIYLPDLPFFRRWANRRRDAQRLASARAEVMGFIQQRDATLAKLSTTRRTRYQALASVCREIESATAETSLTPEDPTADPRLRKLDELMWTFLRLLSIEESFDRFLEAESREELPRLLKEADAEVAELSGEVDALKAKPGSSSFLETKERLLASRLERLEVLRKRQQRIEQARGNHELVISEQERLDQQIKLIRADAIATRNTANFSARIDATIEHLHETNKWLTEMDEFKDLVGDLPRAPGRIGYLPANEPAQRNAPPPLPVGMKRKT